MAAAVPVIDISGFEQGNAVLRDGIANDISSALEEIGFFVVHGHQINPQTIIAVRDLAWRFFDMPLAEKMRSRNPINGAWRGYVTDDENLSYMQDEDLSPNLNEFFGFGRICYGDDPYYQRSFAEVAFPPNIWPEQPGGFKTAAMRFYREIGALIERLLEFLRKVSSLIRDIFATNSTSTHRLFAFSTTRTRRRSLCRVSRVTQHIPTSPP